MSRAAFILILGFALIALPGCQATPPPPPPSPKEPGPTLDELRAEGRALQSQLAKGGDFERRRALAQNALARARREPEREDRNAAAVEALEAAAALKAARPEAPDGYYLSGVAEGLRIKSEALPTPKGLEAMREAFEMAAQRDENYAHGGPYRSLGDLYEQAPAWPVSLGDAEEALFYYREAVRVAPRWPENLLALAKALIARGEGAEARALLDAAEQQLARPQAEVEWDPRLGWRLSARLEALRSELSEG